MSSNNSRKRQRPLHNRHLLVMTVLATATISSSCVGALSPTLMVSSKAKKILDQVKRLGDEPDTDPVEDETSSGWISWMTQGRKTSSLLYREPEELGGIARSDRYSSSDWFHNTITLPSSAILRAIRVPVVFMTSWATFLSLLHKHLLETNPMAAEIMCIPSTPHSLMVSALSLLLVFKTNSAYQRFAEGRKIWETIINNSRDLYRMIRLYENEIGKSKRRRIQRLLAAFPYLLRHRIRPNLVMYRLDD